MLTIEEYNFVEDRLRRELNFIETIKLINALDLDQRTFEEAENPAQYVYYCGECDVVTQLAIQFDHYASPEYLYKVATYYFEELL